MRESTTLLFFAALVLRRWRGPLPCCLCSRQCCTSKRHLSCKMQKEFSYKSAVSAVFFTFIKTGAFYIFSHNMTMNDGIFTYSDIFRYIFHILLCFVTHFWGNELDGWNLFFQRSRCWNLKLIVKICEKRHQRFLLFFLHILFVYIYLEYTVFKYFLFKMKIGETQSFNILW